MKGLRYLGRGEARIAKMPVPETKEGQILLEVAVSALCGSERSDYENGCSFVSGHEFAGIVRETNGCRRLKAGDRVTVNVLAGCGDCYYCRTGQPQFCRELHVCQGGHAQYAAVPEECCIPLPDYMDFEAGVLLGGDTLGVAYRAVNKIRPDFGRVAAVIGAGPIGLGVISLLKYYGYYAAVMEKNQLRCHYAAELAGADEVLGQFSDTCPGERLRELTGGLGADVVFECSGSPLAERTALEIVRPAGTVVFCGENYKGLEIIPSDHIIHKEVTLTGAFYFTRNDFYGLCEIYKRGFDPKTAVTHRMHLDRAPDACSMFFSGKTGKVLLYRDQTCRTGHGTEEKWKD
ncbi:zinc-dependent alcohol dehydrogenase [Murimonas intestini]|uniref:zinc-dependent alcohol dehydrogenase n=1 Tax=Murimonas intestini TaxID=1337051 RepID=UPI001652B19A|nr:zinc-binding dehydrogenase [Murimonas intestini]